MKTNSRISDLISSLRFGGLSLEHLRPYDTKLVLVFDYTLRITRILKCKDAFSTSPIHLAEFDLKSSLWNCRDDAWKSSIFRPLDSACKGQNSILNPHYIQCHRGVISERWLAEYWEAGFIILLAALKICDPMLFRIQILTQLRYQWKIIRSHLHNPLSLRSPKHLPDGMDALRIMLPKSWFVPKDRWHDILRWTEKQTKFWKPAHWHHIR